MKCSGVNEKGAGRLHRRLGRAVRGKKEVWHLGGLPTGQFSPRSCTQAGRTLLSREEGWGEGRGWTQGVRGEGQSVGAAQLGAPHTPVPNLGGPQIPEGSLFKSDL